MLVVTIKDLKISFSNLNLPTRNNTICFKLLVQKRVIGKQTASVLY